jgi:hypothetical protein
MRLLKYLKVVGFSYGGHLRPSMEYFCGAFSHLGKTRILVSSLSGFITNVLYRAQWLKSSKC